MITNIYLIRHGQTDYNKNGIMQGAGIDSSLNETGMEQAKRLSFAMQDEKLEFDVVFSSPLLRALQTAQITTSWQNQQILTDELLREIDCGDMEGRSFAEMDPDLLTGLRNDPYQKYPNGESSADVRKRGLEFMSKISKRNEKTILVFSHGNMIRALSSVIMDMPVEFTTRSVIGNCGINFFKRTDKYYRLIAWNHQASMSVPTP